MTPADTPLGFTASLPVGDVLVEIGESQVNGGPMRHTAKFVLKADRLANVFQSDELLDLSEAVATAIAVIDDFEGTSRLLTLAERWRERIETMDAGARDEHPDGGDA
jgi:hypothetical protein